MKSKKGNILKLGVSLRLNATPSREFFELDIGTKSQLSTGSLWNNILYMTENLYLKFPLIVGQKRTEEFETRVRGTKRRERHTSESSVLGIEQITSSTAA
jgi:hypothetical protein